jgi:hypothetical protein
MWTPRGKDEKKPVGILQATFERLHEAGCIQTLADQEADVIEARRKHGVVFSGLMFITNQNPCDGCPEYKNGTCQAFLKYHTQAARDENDRRVRKLESTAPKGTEKYPGLSVAQIADELHISKSEVRRRKAAGTL